MSTRRARAPVTGKSKTPVDGKPAAIGRTVALDGKSPGNGKSALDSKPPGNGKGALDGRSPVNSKSQANGPAGDRPPSPWRASRERQHDREVKREAVIRAAAHAFNHKGYHNTSLDDIAAALEVTKPTVYYYVTNKEQLLFECFVAGVEQIRAGFREARNMDIPARERLHAVLRHYAKTMASEFGWCMVRVEDQDLSPDMSSHIKAMKSEIDQGIRRLIREGVQDGSIHPCDPKMTAFALAGSLNWIAHWYRQNKSMSGAEIADAFITVFDNGLQPRRGARS
jgi:AcrR family transcriptional regulator